MKIHIAGYHMESEVNRILGTINSKYGSEIRCQHPKQIGKYFQTTFRLPAIKGNDSDDIFRRLSLPYPWKTQFRISSVCYHGHYAIMKGLFNRFPDAILMSKMATFRGQKEFYALANEIGTRNIGSIMFPLAYQDACVCSGWFVKRVLEG